MSVRLVSLVLAAALFVLATEGDARATRTAALPDTAYGNTARSGAPPDAAHPRGTLYMVESTKGALGLMEWDIDHARVVRRVPLGTRDDMDAWHIERTARHADRFYVAAAGPTRNVLLVFDGALHPLFSRELPPGDIDALDADDHVLAVATNLRDYRVRVTNIDPKTLADRGTTVLEPQFVIDELAPCGVRAAVRVYRGAIYARTRCLSQERTFTLQASGRLTSTTAPSGLFPSSGELSAHGLTIVITYHEEDGRTLIKWRDPKSSP
jgi:hypothetical protein